MLFGYALRHHGLARNPVEGTSQLRRAKATPQALTIDQIAAIREAAVTWRSEPGLPGPKPDGQVRDVIKVLLGTAMRPGEVLAFRSCDIEESGTVMPSWARYPASCTGPTWCLRRSATTRASTSGSV